MAGERKLTVKFLGDASGVKGGIKDAESALGKFEGSLKRVGKALVGAFAVREVIEGVGATIHSASDLNETMSKTQVIFGDATDGVVDFADKAARNLGQSKRSALDAASSFALFGKAAGLGDKDLVKFSTSMVGLAGDMASFSNTSPEDAIEAIGAALRGESEPIRKYGVLLDDATLKARAMTLGIYDGTGSLTQQQRVLAAQAEILAQTGAAQGDFARTSDGLANQQRIMSAEMENLKAKIGEKLLPAMVAIATFINDKVIPAFESTVKWIQEHWPEIHDKIVEVFEKIKGYVVPVINFLKDLWEKFGDNIVNYIKQKWDSVKDIVQGAFDAIAGIFSFFKDLLTGRWGKLWQDILDAVTGFGQLIQGAVSGIWNEVKLAVGAVWDTIKGTVASALNGIWDLISGFPGRIANIVSGMWDGFKSGFKAMINWIIDAWNGLQFTIGGWELPFPPHTKFPSVTIGTPDIPRLAAGGIATRPTLALIGESGPEAVVPLNGRNGMGVTNNITINATDPDSVIAAIQRWTRQNGPIPVG